MVCYTMGMAVVWGPCYTADKLLKVHGCACSSTVLCSTPCRGCRSALGSSAAPLGPAALQCSTPCRGCHSAQ